MEVEKLKNLVEDLMINIEFNTEEKLFLINSWIDRLENGIATTIQDSYSFSRSVKCLEYLKDIKKELLKPKQSMPYE